MSLKTSDKIFLKYPLYMLKYVKPYVQKCLYTVHIDISYKLNNFIQNNFYKIMNCYEHKTVMLASENYQRL